MSGNKTGRVSVEQCVIWCLNGFYSIYRPFDSSVNCSLYTDETSGMGSRQFWRGRGRGRELEAEARQTKFEARPRRGDPLKKNHPFPRCIAVPNLVALSQTVWQRVNGLVAPPSWVEVIYVIPMYGSVLPSRGKALLSRPSQDRGKTVWGRDEAEPGKKQEDQLILTTGSTRLAVSRGQQTWYHSTCYI